MKQINQSIKVFSGWNTSWAAPLNWIVYQHHRIILRRFELTSGAVSCVTIGRRRQRQEVSRCSSDVLVFVLQQREQTPPQWHCVSQTWRTQTQGLTIICFSVKNQTLHFLQWSSGTNPEEGEGLWGRCLHSWPTPSPPPLSPPAAGRRCSRNTTAPPTVTKQPLHLSPEWNGLEIKNVQRSQFDCYYWSRVTSYEGSWILKHHSLPESDNWPCRPPAGRPVSGRHRRCPH